MADKARGVGGLGDQEMMIDVSNELQPLDWTFLSNHSRVLICISNWPDIRIRDIAGKVRITERAVQRILVDLEEAGYLKRERLGRHNHYRLVPELHLRHPLSHHVEVGQLLTLLQQGAAAFGLPEKYRQHATVGIVPGLDDAE